MHRRRRWVWLAPFLLVYTLFLFYVATLAVIALIEPAELLDWETFFDAEFFTHEVWWVWCGVPVLTIVATQAVFVVPVINPRLRLTPRGRSVAFSLVAIGIVAAALVVAGYVTIFELVRRRLPDDELEAYLRGAPIAIIFFASWGVWSALLIVFTQRRRHETRLDRLVTMLLAGTVIEVLAIIPVDIMARRRTDCYCDTGTFYALLLSTLAAMWLAGPGALILYMRRRRRRARVRCIECGYVKGPSPGEYCPECGHAWLDL